MSSTPSVFNLFSRRSTFADPSCARDNNLDALRLFFALSVVVSHAFFLTGRRPEEPVYAYTQDRLELGDLAVNAFFVISGFLIANSWIRSKSLWDYSKKRIARIYPGFIVDLVLCAFVVAPLGGAEVPEWLSRWRTYEFIVRPLTFRHVVSMRGVFPNNFEPFNVNAPLWTIRFELICYMLVALLGLAGLMKRRWIVLGAFVASVAYLRAMPWVIQVPYFDFLDQLPRFTAFFLAGSVVYVWRDVIPRNGLLAAMCFAVLLASRGRGSSFIWPLLFPYLVLYVGMTRRPALLKRLEGNDISYGVYLYGWPVHQLIIHHWPRLWLAPSMLLALVITCVIAFASWRFIEKPFLMRARGGNPRPADTGKPDPEHCPAPITAGHTAAYKAA